MKLDRAISRYSGSKSINTFALFSNASSSTGALEPVGPRRNSHLHPISRTDCRFISNVDSSLKLAASYNLIKCVSTCVHYSGYLGMKKRWCLVVMVFTVRLIGLDSRYILPEVPDVLHPPVPDVVTSDNSTEELEDLDPEVTPGLFQGDMAMTNEIYNYWRVGLKWDVFPDKLWTKGIVPYVISPLYEPMDQVTIHKAIRTLNFMTCIKFVPWSGKVKDYLLIWPILYPRGCWSFVGKYGGAQIVSLQPPDDNGPNCLGTEGRAIHELMHALGTFHEQSRWDRDKFVKIHTDNIIPKFKSNFDKQSLENTTYSFEYDYDSIMHYGRYYFSKARGKPTITAKQPGITKLGQRKAMSKGDCLKLNDLYGCLDNPKLSKKYYNRCKFLGV